MAERKDVQKILQNLPEGNGEAKSAAKPEVGARVLSEIDSLRIEILTKDQQIMNLRQELLASQKKILATQEESMKLQQSAQAKEADKLISDLGMTGTVNLVKNAEGRYVVNGK